MGSELTTVTQPVGFKPPQTADEEAVRAALDLLATGGCDQSAFVQAMQRRFQSEPGGNWELLSQLDQYYRRGKIKSEMFNAIKAALAGPALGAGNDAVSHAAAPAALGDAPRRAKEPQPLAAALQLKPGDRLRDRYRIERVLGQGGMGAVFEAVDDYRLDALPSGQRLAIKVLHTAVTTRTELFTELRREFQNLQILSHPNIVRVYEFDRDGPLAFFTMELLSGELLSRVLLARRAPLEYAHALAVLRDVGAAIAYAHSRGVEHGDINPQNIFVTSRGDLRVLDFGSSHQLLADPLGPDTEIKPARFATPGYASCQVLEGEHPDARDDIFALACVAYRLFCGEHPFSEGSAVEARTAGSKARKPMKLTHRQWRVLREGLHWDRKMRPRDVQQWLERLDLRGAAKSLPALTELLDPRPAANSGFGFPNAQALLAALGLVVVLAFGGGWFVRNYTASPPVTARAPSATAGAPTDIPRAPTDSPGAAAGIAATLPPESAREDVAPLADSQPPPSETAVVAPAIAPAIAPPVAPPVAPPTARPVAPPSSASSIPAPPARPAKIEMAAPIVDVPPAEANARVVVRRKGNLRGAIGFTWWTESGTAKPGTDFAPVVPQIAIIRDGESSVTLSIPVTGSSRAESKNFYVVIDLPEGNAELGAQALAMVSLPPTS
jgi:serine/threonine protein kinase